MECRNLVAKWHFCVSVWYFGRTVIFISQVDALCYENIMPIETRRLFFYWNIDEEQDKQMTIHDSGPQLYFFLPCKKLRYLNLQTSQLFVDFKLLHIHSNSNITSTQTETTCKNISQSWSDESPPKTFHLIPQFWAPPERESGNAVTD